MIQRILAVAGNTWKEAHRNRAFTVLLLLGLALNGTGWALAKLAVRGQGIKVIQDFGYFAVSIVAVITAIMMGIILLYKELDKKTVYSLLPKPVMRYEVVLGKFVGLITLISCVIAVLGSFWLLLMWHLDALEVNGQSIVNNAWMSMILMALEAMVVTSIALMFTSWTRPLLSGIFTLGYFLMGRWIFLIQEHIDSGAGVLAEPGPLRTFAQVMTYIVPDLQTFNMSREIALGIDIHAGYVGASGMYALSFTAVFLLFGIWLFSRRDFV